jgi:GNAT superfamily N-acetyltransferase
MQVAITKISRQNFSEFIALICELADFEHLEGPDAEARERLHNDAFCEHPRYEAFLVRNDADLAVGYIIIFETYSSFLAKPTLYLEDLYIQPQYRGSSIGTQCMHFLIAEARKRACGRIEWQVLDWNTSAIKFYNKLGAVHMKEWLPYRITEDKFDTLTQLT